MFRKLFGSRKLAPSPGSIQKEQQREEGDDNEKEKSAALKIVHAGGHVELYYMAVPAASIIAKYPSFTLTRPDVFRRPWDAIVSPEEILFPGQKYLVVPIRTVKKLKRRIKKPIGSLLANYPHQTSSITVDSSVSEESSRSNSSFVHNRFGILIKSKSKIKGHQNRRVRFFGIDTMQDSISCDNTTSGAAKNIDGNRSQNHQISGESKKSMRSSVLWEPSLTSIIEDR